MEESPVNSPDQAGFADINNNQEPKTTSDKSIDSPEGKAIFSQLDYHPGFKKPKF